MLASEHRIALIDIGSNTIKLLVADFGNGQLRQTIHFESDETRLGEHLGQPAAIMSEKTIQAGTQSVQKLQKIALGYHPDQIGIVATSAVREADNRTDFCLNVLEKTGLTINLLSGLEEAEAIARGARCDPAFQDISEFYMLDQGGGSLEMIQWSNQKTLLASLPLGAVRLFQQFQGGSSGPMSSHDEEAIYQWVEQQWNSVTWLESPSEIPWIGTGGALTLIRSLLAERQGQTFENSSHTLSRRTLQDFYLEISSMSVMERMDVAHIPASRADILPAGLLAIIRVMDLAKVDRILHSVYNLRYGYAAKLAATCK